MPDKRDQRNEPTLEELLSDPITWMVMKSDKVGEHELRDLLKRVAAEFAGGSTREDESESSAEHDDAFRKGVGIMLLNERNEVFVGQRADSQQSRSITKSNTIAHSACCRTGESTNECPLPPNRQGKNPMSIMMRSNFLADTSF